MSRGGRDKPGEGGFAARWSRLKQEAREAPQEVPTEKAAPDQQAVDAAAEDRTDAEILEELGLPEPESLAPGDDFSAFMAKSVPTRLRNRALRRLWRSNPVLAHVDDLLDYNEDFGAEAVAGGVFETAYRVGRGLTDRARDAAEDGDEAAPESPEDAVAEAPPEAPAEAAPDAAGADVAEAPADPSETQDEMLRGKRRKTMRFSFDDDEA